MKKGKIAKFESLGMLDGPAVRMVIFMQGCILRCAYCHNPALLTFDGGEQYTPKQLLDKVLKYKNYLSGGGGVTVSGGEPLCQTEFLIEFFKLCKQNQIHTCLDTSGVGFGDFDTLLKYTDIVLLDIKHTVPSEFEKLTLIKKVRIESFNNALIKNQNDIWIRQVIIPELTDNQTYLDGLLKEILKFKNVKKIEFLPFHTMADEVYEKLGIENRFRGKLAMDNVKCKQLEELFVKNYQKFNKNLINKI